jgi:hypothetical protein
MNPFRKLCRSLGIGCRVRKTSSRSRPHHTPLQLEALEDRLVPAAHVEPTLMIHHPGAGQRAATSGTAGYVPAQIRTAYGINGIAFGSTSGDGSGQTIAIVDAYNDPNILGDLNVFDQAYALAPGSSQTLYQHYGAAASFVTVYNQNGQVINPSNTSVPVDSTGGWEVEESLDVEWAHAIAPSAKIDLIVVGSAGEAGGPTLTDLFTGARAAAGLPGVSVVSMSWTAAGSNGAPSEFSGETSYDSYFTTPSGHQGVTFLGATGDQGAPGGYPAYSPNVVAVGGTTLQLNASDAIQSEAAWSGSGGGISPYEAEPAYQQGVQSTGHRTVPDVAFDADPNTGVAVYDSFNASGWEQIGGTSLATPCWAGLIAIANQGRGLQGLATLNSSTNPTQTLTALYSLPSSDFHDITSGSNGTYSAGAGYDLVTGLGSPVANLLVPALAHYGSTTSQPDHLVVTVQPPGSVTAGSAFSVTVAADTSSGTVDSSFHGSVTIALGSNPGGSTLGGTLTVTAVNGVATFSNLTLNNPGTGYTLQASSSGLTGVTSNAFNVTAVATSGPVSFVLLTSGQLEEHSSSGWTALASGIAAISNQGVDNSGRAMIDAITTSGTAYEYHNGLGWVSLGSGAASAVAGHGVSYVLFTNGYLDEYNDASGKWTYIVNGVASISAGTDAQGNNAVDVVLTSGNAWEHSDSTGWYFIASGVRSVSAGSQGIADYVTTGGNAYQFSQATGKSTYLAANVAQVTAGTDANGYAMIDLLFSNGNLYEYRASGGWSFLASGVASISKARAGLIDVVFSNGNAEEHTAAGNWNFLTGSARMAV